MQNGRAQTRPAEEVLGLAGATGGGAGSGTVTYRAELSERVLGQLGGFPAKAFDALIATMAVVVEYPDDPMRTFPTGEPYVRRAGACADSGSLVEAKASALAASWLGEPEPSRPASPESGLAAGRLARESLTSRCLGSITDRPGTVPGVRGDRPGRARSPERRRAAHGSPCAARFRISVRPRRSGTCRCIPVLSCRKPSCRWGTRTSWSWRRAYPGPATRSAARPGRCSSRSSSACPRQRR